MKTKHHLIISQFLKTKNKFRLPYVFILRFKQSLMYQSTKIWNELPENIKMQNSNSFKLKLETHIISSY